MPKSAKLTGGADPPRASNAYILESQSGDKLQTADLHDG
jgi:hypothetical protein